jgi:hypothetical protein
MAYRHATIATTASAPQPGSQDRPRPRRTSTQLPPESWWRPAPLGSMTVAQLDPSAALVLAVIAAHAGCPRWTNRGGKT